MPPNNPDRSHWVACRRRCAALRRTAGRLFTYTETAAVLGLAGGGRGVGAVLALGKKGDLRLPAAHCFVPAAAVRDYILRKLREPGGRPR